MASPAKYSKKPALKLAAISTLVYFLAFWVPMTAFKGAMLANILYALFYTIPVLAAFVSCLWACQNSKSYHRLWGLMALGMFLWLLGVITISFYVVPRGPANVPSPNLADIFSLAYLPIMLAIIISLGKIRLPLDTEKKQFLVSIAMLSLTMLLLLYKFVLAPSWYSKPDMSIMQRISTISYPVLDWITLVSILIVSGRFFERKIEGWLILLISAFTCSVLADIPAFIFGYQMNYITLSMLVVGAILITAAAIDEVTGVFIGINERHRTTIKGLTGKQTLKTNIWQTFIMPLASITVIPIVLLFNLSNLRLNEIYFLVAGSALVSVLSVYRNHLLASDNAILFEKALRDPLTGLHNHRYFQEALDKAIHKSAKANKPCSLLILDIDNFMKINNTNGFIFGDKVLAAIGNIILAEMREDDEACRLSGDEFGIILPKTDGIKAYAIAEKIRKAVNKNSLETFSNSDITITIGISVYPTLAKDKGELLHTADGALYWSKLKGKNRSFVYDPKVVEVLSAEERAKRAEESVLAELVRSLAKAVDARDPYTKLHSKRVSFWAGNFAKHLGLDKDAVNRIEVAGILHDIGKIGIPDSILKKTRQVNTQRSINYKRPS
ncbi:MAG: diguanylate cyclase [Firmicutes bacterium]|nr:diguanylate cyclase [Bacillota bacterium]